VVNITTIYSDLKIHLNDPDLAKKLYKAILPEVSTTKSKASKVSIHLKDGTLHMEIEAATVAGVRALLNSYIRWITTSLEVVTLEGD
jgi:tRNA threonylcarbamoyladenosine modification (KEOPS) complex  Pcc1 subunit